MKWGMLNVFLCVFEGGGGGGVQGDLPQEDCIILEVRRCDFNALFDHKFVQSQGLITNRRLEN